MCGIIGHIGKRKAAPVLVEALRRLEYRGCDSAGLAVVHQKTLHCHKKRGEIDEGLTRILTHQSVPGHLGVGHTRWATHGPPSDENSHPLLDASGKIALVHNGIIENFEQLKQQLQDHQFHSNTDTEVFAHLVGLHYEQTRQ